MPGLPAVDTPGLAPHVLEGGGDRRVHLYGDRRPTWARNDDNGATGAPGNGAAPVKPRCPAPLPSRRAHARKKAAPLVVRRKGPL